MENQQSGAATDPAPPSTRNLLIGRLAVGFMIALAIYSWTLFAIDAAEPQDVEACVETVANSGAPPDAIEQVCGTS